MHCGEKAHCTLNATVMRGSAYLYCAVQFGGVYVFYSCVLLSSSNYDALDWMQLVVAVHPAISELTPVHLYNNAEA